MDYLKFLEKVVNQNSFTSNKKGVDKVGEMISKELSFMDVKRYEDKEYGDLLVFTSKKNNTNKPQIIMCGHSDTVHPPEINIPITYRGDKMYGPGTQDMKGGLVAIIETLKTLHQSGKLSNITFSLVPNEELQWPAHRSTLENIYKGFEYGLVYEPTMQMKEIGPYAKNKRSIVTNRKGTAWVRYTITGPGGHSGVLTNPKSRISAIQEAGHLINQIDRLANYKLGSTTNVGKISGGTVYNVIPDYCEIEADYRAETQEEDDRIRQAYEALGNSAVIQGTSRDYEMLSYVPPMTPNNNTPKILKAAHAAAKKAMIELVEEKRGGGSDACVISSLGVSTIDGLGVQGEGEHTQNEFIYIDSIKSSIDFSLELLINLLD